MSSPLKNHQTLQNQFFAKAAYLAVHGIEKLVVGLGGGQFLQQKLHTVDHIHGGQHFA
jgi:hypothetical protein